MLIIFNFISPLLPSPFSLSSNSLSTFSRSEAVLYSPQLLGRNLSLEFSYSSEFSNILSRYFFGIQFYYFGFGWYSIKADEFFENLIAFGLSYKNFGIGMNLEPQNVLNDLGNMETKFYLRSVLGFYKYIQPFWFSGSILYEGNQGRNAGIFSFRYSSKNYDIFIDALLEENYPLSYAISSLIKAHKNVNLILGYNTSNMVFSFGIIILSEKLKLAYQFKTHPFLGNSNSLGVSY